VDLHAVETGVDRVGCGLTKVVDDARQFVDLERTRLGHLGEAVVDEGLGLGTDGRRGHRCAAAGLQVDMRDPAHVPQLNKDLAALGMHGLGDLAPAVDLRLGVQTGGVLVALGLCGDLRGLGDQQAGRSPLAVVGRRQRAGHQAGAGPIACQRGQDDAVAQGQRAQLVGFEQGFFSHVFFLPCRSVKPRHPSTASTHATRSQNSRNKHRTAMMMVII